MRIIRAIGACGVLALTATAAFAQTYPLPARPIRVIVGTPAGTTTDGVARIFARRLNDELGGAVVVENLPGAGSLVAIRRLLQAQPDGYTLHVAVGSALAQGPAVRQDLPYDPLRDFTLIGFLGVLPGAIAVHADVPARSVAELVAYTRANPDKLSYGTAGIGSAGHLQAEYFMSVTGARIFHVPFKSDNDAARELASGVVQVVLNTALPALALAPTGKIRVLAVTAPRRLPRLVEVPTVAELGLPGLDGLVPYSFLGIVGPAGMPAAVAERVGEAVNRVGALPEVIAQLREGYLLETRPGTPAQFRTFIEAEIKKWRALGKSVKLTE